MPDRLNRRILIRSVVTLVAIAAVVGALFAVDAKTDIISSALHIPAVRDSSTPEIQDGFDLAGIERVHDQSKWHSLANDGDTVLTVECNWKLHPTGPYADDLYFFFSAGGHSSTGSRFPVRFNPSPPDGKGPNPLTVQVILPGTYPSSYKWIDVSMSSNDGHKALWRISRLPRTHPTYIDDAPTNRAVSLSGGARIDCITHSLSRRATDCDLSFSESGDPALPAGEFWQITPVRSAAQFEWETRDMEVQRSHASPTVDDGGITCLFQPGKPTGTWDHAWCPYPESRYFREIAELDRVAIFTEHVTFHDIPVEPCRSSFYPSVFDDDYCMTPPADQSATTPSGCTLRLLASPASPFISGDAINALVETDPSGISWGDGYYQAPFLRQSLSPIYRKYNLPVQIEASVEGHDTVGETEPGTEPAVINLPLFQWRQHPAVMKTVTFAITQRAIIDRRFVTFTFDRSRLPVYRLNLWHRPIGYVPA